VTRLYVAQATGSNDPVPASQLEHATGDRIYYVPPSPGFKLFEGKGAGLRTLPRSAIDFRSITRGKTLQFAFKPTGTPTTYLAGEVRRHRAPCPWRRRDRTPGGSLPRDGVTPLRRRAAGAELPDDGVARAAHASDGDSRARRRVARGRRGRSGRARRVAGRDR